MKTRSHNWVKGRGWYIANRIPHWHYSTRGKGTLMGRSIKRLVLGEDWSTNMTFLGRLVATNSISSVRDKK